MSLMYNTNINCVNCTNCADCVDCVNCKNCVNCNKCTNIYGGRNLYYETNCVYTNGKEDNINNTGGIDVDTEFNILDNDTDEIFKNNSCIFKFPINKL